MIIVLGDVRVRADALQRALDAALVHVRRSRTEPGCLSHDVAQDAENPNRLLFTERWQDEAALRTHFAVAGSRDFVKELAQWVTERPTMEIFESTSVPM